MHREQDGIDYYNTGSWTDTKLTYVTVNEEGVQIHEYIHDGLAGNTGTNDRDPGEERGELIPRLLTSLTMQDYSRMRITPVLVADASSTDGTPDIVRSFGDRLTVDVIPGGMPAVGRNRGAALATTRYVLFFRCRTLNSLSHGCCGGCLEKMQERQLHLATTNILCQGKIRRQDSLLGQRFLPVSVVHL